MPTRILVLGGGFGGIYTAIHLEKQLAREAGVRITLVNRENSFLFTPMLHEVAASDLDITHIVNPIRKLLRRVDFFEGTVESIDLPTGRVIVSHGEDRHRHELEYDHLVIALGSTTNFYGIPRLEERALTMKSLGDAVELRNQLIESLEQADFECTAPLREALLTFVVAGGGFAGVETAAALNDFVREALTFYRHVREDQVRVVLVHAGPHILPELGEDLGRYAQQKLAERGVQILVNTTLKGVTDEGVVLGDGGLIHAKTLVWTAGTAPHPLLASLPCMKEGGRVGVDEYLRVTGWPGVWALGDCASIPDLTTGRRCPPTAQHALRQGRTVAYNIAASIRQGTPARLQRWGPRQRAMQPFRFATIGQLAAIGRRTGVARIFGMKFSGCVAWWLWRTIYLSKLPRLEKKVRVALDWSLDLLFSKDLVELGSARSRPVIAPVATPENALETTVR